MKDARALLSYDEVEPLFLREMRSERAKAKFKALSFLSEEEEKKEKKQSRHKKDGKTGHCGRYGHTRPGRWLPALSPRIPMRCTAFTLRRKAVSENGQENPFTSG